MAINVEEEFKRHEDSYKFEDIENKRSNCREIHAFMLLNDLIPTHTMICSAEHDQIWLDIDVEKLAEVATSEQIKELSQCGVFYDNDIDLLSMYK